jgi:sulfatase maturation enzyme AslB (radical SAM superfamily)
MIQLMHMEGNMMNYQEYEDQWAELPKLHKILRTPPSLDIEITSKCNLQCSHCPFHKPDPLFERDPMNMDFEMYKQIIDEVSKKDTKTIKFNFGGEPTIYPKIVEAIQYAREKGISDVMMNTNAIALTPSLSEALCKAGLTTLIISDYNIPRQVENTERFSTLRESYDCMLIMNKMDCSEKWEWLNIDKIVTSKFYDFEKLKQDYIVSYFKCDYPWQRFIVLVDGTIMTCSCGTIDPSKMIGCFPKDTIEEMWTGKAMNALRKEHKLFRSHNVKYCRTCHLRKEYLIEEYKKKLGIYEI